MSCEGRIPLAYRVRSKAKPVNGSALEINSRGCWMETCDLLLKGARRTDAAKAAMKSRRRIRNGSSSQLCHTTGWTEPPDAPGRAYLGAGIEWVPFTLCRK